MPSTVIVKHTPKGKRKERRQEYTADTLIYNGRTLELDGGGTVVVTLRKGESVSYNEEEGRLTVWYA